MQAKTVSISHPAAPYRKSSIGPRSVARRVPPLVNGDRLDADEFMRRYEAMPELKKAELLDGVVYVMASPVRYDRHGDPDNLVQSWLGIYGIHTKGVRASTNATARIDIKNVPQPDASLRFLPERGGRTHGRTDGYLSGAPELIVEISGSSRARDLNPKFNVYRLAGAREYIVVLTIAQELKWWRLEDGKFVPLLPDDDGISRSRVFPGLWLDAAALFKGDGKRVMAVLRKGLRSKEHAAFAKQIS